jgi:hypothetical protein
MKKSYFLFIVFLLCTVSLALAMGGGGGSASSKTYRGFEGKITDENGKALKGVDVTLLAVDPAVAEGTKEASESDSKKNLSSTTGSNGRYRFIAVRPGFYRVRYSSNGFQTLEKLMEFKRGGKDAVMNIKLKEISSETNTASSQN